MNISSQSLSIQYFLCTYYENPLSCFFWFRKVVHSLICSYLGKKGEVIECISPCSSISGSDKEKFRDRSIQMITRHRSSFAMNVGISTCSCAINCGSTFRPSDPSSSISTSESLHSPFPIPGKEAVRKMALSSSFEWILVDPYERIKG